MNIAGRKGFSKELKSEILEKHFIKGYSTRLLANEYGVSRASIQNWKKKYIELNGNPDYKPSSKKTQRNTKVVNLKDKDELYKELQMQIDILTSFQKELERWDVSK